MNKKILYTFYASLVINVILLSAVLVLALQSKTIVNVPRQLNQEMQVQDGSKQKPAQEIYDINVSSTPLTIEKNEYLEKSLNFSMKYPSTLTQPYIFSIVADEKDRPDVGHVVLYDKSSKEWWDACESCLEGGPDQIGISIYKNVQKLSPKDWIIENKNGPYIYSNYDYLSQDLESIFVGGKSAVKYSWSGLGGVDVVVLSDDKNDLIYMISAGYMSDNSTIRGDLWYVISSFELLNNE